MCVHVEKSKTINILDVKLVKNSDIIKLENFNTAGSIILTNKIRQINSKKKEMY